MKIAFLGLVSGVILLFTSCSQKDTKMYPVNIIPAPVSLEQQTGAFHLNEQTAILVSTDNSETSGAIELFAETLQLVTGFSIPIKTEGDAKNCIVITTDKQISTNTEAYKLVVNSESVQLTG